MKRFRIALLGAMLAITACSARSASEDWVTSAESAHRIASERLDRGDVGGARQALVDATENPPPRGTNAEDARVVKQDLYYRLAVLEVSQSRPEQAVHWATLGLDLGARNDVFTANLHIARGKALESRGDASGASRDYHDALLISEALLDESLGK